jgi:hypothetical protein
MSHASCMCGKIKKTTFNFTILQGIKGSNNLGGFKIRIADINNDILSNKFLNFFRMRLKTLWCDDSLVI